MTTDADRSTRVGVVRETAAGENRVALGPRVVSSLVSKGVQPVIVESGAGDAALIPDQLFVAEQGTVKTTSAADSAIQMAYAGQVIVVPGYGMAVAQAQHAVKDMASILEKKAVEVKYAIHAVAGGMPGHMNALFAEADVEYDAMKEMDDINGEFSPTDVTLVIGANDVANPLPAATRVARFMGCRS